MSDRTVLPDSDRGRVLRALGHSPLVLRGAVAQDTVPQQNESGRVHRTDEGAAALPILCLLVAGADSGAADSRLLGHLLRTLGLRRDQVCFAARPNVPQLRLALSLTTLAGDATAKRALWPELRGWRRRLSGGDTGAGG